VAELPPSLAARFEAVRVVGQGGFGQVLEVRERTGGRRGALKRVALRGDGERELREARIASQLRDPGLVEVYEVGLLDGEVFLFLELAEGTLEDLLDQRDPRRALDLLADAGSGLTALHRAGLVHRDVKAANVLRVAGRGKLADLGLVRGGDLRTLTATGVILGTPDYLAPELARGERAEPAADVFAYAALAYRILAGHGVYRGESPGEVVMAAARGEVASLEATGLPAGPARRTLAAALAGDPAARPGEVEEVVDALRTLANEPDLEAPRAPRPGGTTLPPAATRMPRARAARRRSSTGARPRPPGHLGRRLAPLGLALGASLLVGWALQIPQAAPEGPPAPPPPPANGEDPLSARFTDLKAQLEAIVQVLVAPGVRGFLNSRELAALPPEDQRWRVDDPVILRFGRFCRAFATWIEDMVAAGRAAELDGLDTMGLELRLESFLYGYRNLLRDARGLSARSILDKGWRAPDPMVAERARRLHDDVRSTTLGLADRVEAVEGLTPRFSVFFPMRLHSVIREGSTWRYLDPAVELLGSVPSPDVAWEDASTIVTAIHRYGDILPGRCEARRQILGDIHERLPEVPDGLTARAFTAIVVKFVSLEARMLEWCAERESGGLGRVETMLRIWSRHAGVRASWESSRAQGLEGLGDEMRDIRDTPMGQRLATVLGSPAPPDL
jgi:serine/threonine-protein kinase